MAKQLELNLVEFIEKYGTEELCIAHLFDHKWPNGYVCEKCGAILYLTNGSKLYPWDVSWA